jgi:hypothetical protein
MQATQTTSSKSEQKTLETSPEKPSRGFARFYRVSSVDRADAPANADGDWYRYILEGGRSPITGLRRGTLAEVTDHATRCANELNERNNGKSPSAWAPKKTAAAK